jgi:antitoxin component YwqK of YwqJK toxin-antitoxin module
MAMATSVLQAPGHISPLILLFVAACMLSCDRNDPEQFYNSADPNIKTHRGVIYLETTPITGVVFTLDHENDTTAIIPYRDGKRDGIEILYHDNGQKRSVRYYSHGWKTGEHLGYHPSGKPSFIYHFTDDVFDGNQKEWLENGVLYSDMNYERGTESGLQRVWYADGTIKTNYIIKNNRRYGLLGTKNCINTADSVLNKL